LIGNLLENIKYLIKISAVAIFSILVFEFIHSELDLIKCEQDTHSEHDYCVLVEKASLNDSNHRSFEILKNNIPVLNSFLSEINALRFFYTAGELFDYSIELFSNNIYILHNSLLI
jgi:hypothetical protein